MKKYIRTESGITTSDIATHVLTEDIVCAGYGRVLEKGSLVRFGKKWNNWYGVWVDAISMEGVHYSIRPDHVEIVAKELPQADAIEELCDYFVVFDDDGHCSITRKYDYFIELHVDAERHCYLGGAYGAIKTDKGLIYVAKMNEKGNLELI